jgi:EAL domain-containing protein (putative c-di-GMP-specific phosphodiesterase class I)
MTGRYLSNRAGTRWDIGLRRALERVRGSLLRRPHPAPLRGPACGLDDHERALADLQRLAQIGTLTWDLETGSIFWSSEIYRILGLRDDDAPPTLATWRKLVHPDDRVEFDHGLAEMSRKLTTYAASYRIIRPDGRPVRISVNVSPRQLAQGDLAATVGRVLTDTGLEPGLLELELTEQMLADDIEQGIESLSDLKSLGVRLVLDDFGTGYSSLSYLRQLTIDALKIDRSFVDGLGRGTADGAIVGAVLSMAGALGLGVTAEGVETQAQLARLREHGCDYAQGFLFCRPSSADDVTELLRTADHAAARWCEGVQTPSAAA